MTDIGKHNKILVKWNICDLVFQEFLFFLILRDNKESGNKNFMLSLQFQRKEDALEARLENFK